MNKKGEIKHRKFAKKDGVFEIVVRLEGGRFKVLNFGGKSVK